MIIINIRRSSHVCAAVERRERQNYEEKNGPVRAYKNKKKDVGDVFDL